MHPPSPNTRYYLLVQAPALALFFGSAFMLNGTWLRYLLVGAIWGATHPVRLIVRALVTYPHLDLGYLSVRDLLRSIARDEVRYWTTELVFTLVCFGLYTVLLAFVWVIWVPLSILASGYDETHNGALLRGFLRATDPRANGPSLPLPS